MPSVQREIKRIGNYLEVDADGFIIKAASPGSIQDKWRPAVRDVALAYSAAFGSALHSVYVRGSVAKGEAIDYFSDLDTIAVVKVLDPTPRLDNKWIADVEWRMATQYPFISRHECVALPLDRIGSSRPVRIVIQTQAVCVCGLDLAAALPRVKVGREAAYQYLHARADIERSIRALLTSKSGIVGAFCTWIMKKVLRTSFELVMERERRYTRDLHPCYESFSKYYPDRREEMYAVLQLAINPTVQRDLLLRVLVGCLSWLPREIEAVFGEAAKERGAPLSATT